MFQPDTNLTIQLDKVSEPHITSSLKIKTIENQSPKQLVRGKRIQQGNENPGQTDFLYTHETNQ